MAWCGSAVSNRELYDCDAGTMKAAYEKDLKISQRPIMNCFEEGFLHRMGGWRGSGGSHLYLLGAAQKRAGTQRRYK